MDCIPRVYSRHPQSGWEPQQFAQLILDPAHPTVQVLLPLHKHLDNSVEAASKILCFAWHRKRALLFGYRA